MDGKLFSGEVTKFWVEDKVGVSKIFLVRGAKEILGRRQNFSNVIRDDESPK